MNTAQKGANAERSLRKLLESDGYSVMRGAGSKGECLGFKSDLIATKSTQLNETKVEIILIAAQCKVKRIQK